MGGNSGRLVRREICIKPFVFMSSASLLLSISFPLLQQLCIFALSLFLFFYNFGEFLTLELSSSTCSTPLLRSSQHSSSTSQANFPRASRMEIHHSMKRFSNSNITEHLLRTERGSPGETQLPQRNSCRNPLLVLQVPGTTSMRPSSR